MDRIRAFVWHCLLLADPSPLSRALLAWETLRVIHLAVTLLLLFQTSSRNLVLAMVHALVWVLEVRSETCCPRAMEIVPAGT